MTFAIVLSARVDKQPTSPYLPTQISTLALTEQLVHFEHMSAALDERVVAQTTKLASFHGNLATLCSELDEDLEEAWAAAGGGPGGTSADLSDGALQRFANKVTEIEAAKVARVAAVLELVQQCQELIGELAIDAASETGSLDSQIMGSLDDTGAALASIFLSATCVGIGASSLANLQARHGQLCEERDARSAYLMAMGEKVAQLWALLSIGEEEQHAFEESLTGGLSEATIKVGEAELTRLEALKATKMTELIENKRAAISALWDATAATESQRSTFAGFFVADSPGAFTDELLEAHESEIASLEKRLETMQPLVQLWDKYEQAVVARAELEELQKDKDRLKGRNSSKQLKIEEQMAKQIKQLPKLMDAMKKEVSAWEAAEGATFTVMVGVAFKACNGEDGAEEAGGCGQPCLASAEAFEEAYKARKDMEAAEKKAAKNKDRDSAVVATGNAPGGKRSSLAEGGSKAAKRPSMNPLADANR